MRKKRYTPSFYSSKVWLDWKKLLLEWRDNKCEHCGATEELHIHHKNYDTFGGEELPFDLLVLCKKCHSKLHDLVKQVMRGEIWL